MLEEYRSKVFLPSMFVNDSVGSGNPDRAAISRPRQHRPTATDSHFPWFWDGQTGVLFLDRWRDLTASRPW
jgi:hypothetical protein